MLKPGRLFGVGGQLLTLARSAGQTKKLGNTLVLYEQGDLRFMYSVASLFGSNLP